MALPIDQITNTPGFVFLWSGSGVSLQWGRACLRKWGFRRCEDICWIKSNRESGRNVHYLPDGVVTATTEHCLVGIRGTVRRNYDGHVIHANVRRPRRPAPQACAHLANSPELWAARAAGGHGRDAVGGAAVRVVREADGAVLYH